MGEATKAAAKKNPQKIVHIDLKQNDNDDKKKPAALQPPQRKEKGAKKKQDNFKSKFEERIVTALSYYRELLREYVNRDVSSIEILMGQDEAKAVADEEKADTIVPTKSRRISSKEVAETMARFESENVSEEEQELALKELEMNLDLSDFNLESEWTVTFSEDAIKWFKKHQKKQNDFCERVIARLKILGTGRFTYTLCKPLNTNSKMQLYESKVDSGSRIIWEVATEFSRRRSSAGNTFYEQ